MATQTLTISAAGTTTSGWLAEGGDYTRLQTDDGDTTRLYSPTSGDVYQCNLTDTSGLNGVTVNSVTVYIKVFSLDPISNTVQIGIRTNATDYYATAHDTNTNNTSYVTFSDTWTTNPNTGVAWTVADLNALQIGAKKGNAPGMRWTYGYAVVNYTAAAPIVLTSGAVFRDNGTLTNWTTTGANTTYGGNNGMFGALGASTSMHIAFSGAAYVFEGAQKNIASEATIFQFFYRPATTATLGAGNTIFSVFTDNTFTGTSRPIRIDTKITGTKYSLQLVDPSSSYANSAGTTLYDLGVPLRIVLTQTSAGWQIYVNNGVNPEVSYVKTQAIVGYKYVSVGTFYDNAAGSYTGVADFGEFWFGNMNQTTPTTVSQKIADTYQGYLQNHLAVSGQPYRITPDGVNVNYASGYIDTVSESVAYLEKLAVQNNDQATFKLVDNWTLQNLLRRNSTTVNTALNAAPTDALNLMAFHYNSANTDGKGIGTIYDASLATDADVERGQVLLWAHSRFGSSSNTVGSPAELLTPNYLQRALNVINDLRISCIRSSPATGYYYLMNDARQTGDLVQIAPDYNNPAAIKLFAQYDTANASTWNSLVAGTYDLLTKAANQVMTGTTPAQSTTAKLNPDWIQFTLSTGLTNGTPSTYGDSDYGFNAFRTSNRLYDMYTWYGDTNALTVLRIPKTFWVNEWSVNAKMRAVFKHDGTALVTYESNMIGFANYWTIYANDTGNTTASAIQTNKLSMALNYVQSPVGSYYNTAPGGNLYDYYSQSWLNVNYMQQAGTWINYGQAATAATPTNLFFF